MLPAVERTSSRTLWIRRAIGLAAGVLLLVIGNAINNNLVDYAQDIVRQCGIAVIMAVSLNIVNGLTGQFSIGHAGFMSVGAYVAAAVTYWFVGRFAHGDPAIFVKNAPLALEAMAAAMLAAGAAAALFGYVVGVPSLRLKGDYLAIVTLGFGEIIRVLLESIHEISPRLDFMGGATGFSGVSGNYTVPRLSTFPLVFATVLIVILIARNLKFSTHGLAFMAVRENEIAADAMGIDSTRVKVSAFVLSAFFAGVGGALFAHALFFQPRTFSFILSINYVVMVVLGGSGSITGATIAAVLLTALPEYLKSAQDQAHFRDEYRLVAYSLLLVGMMILRPSGIFGSGELSLARWKRQRRDALPERTAGEAAAAHVFEPAVPFDGDEVLRLAGLTRRFGGLTAVGDIEVAVKRGELVGLIGPNGAGKTTLFNLLTGVYEPSEGTIRFLGKPLAGARESALPARTLRTLVDTAAATAGGGAIGTVLATSLIPYASTPGSISAQSAIRWAPAIIGGLWALFGGRARRRRAPGLRPYQFAERGISRTFQNIRLFGDLSVLDNVRTGMYLRRRTGLFDGLLHTSREMEQEAADTERARLLLAQANLTRVEGERARSLPYGDQRRLEIVRALATRPRLLLLDEPAAGMNPQEKQELSRFIQEIRQEHDLTIIVIEHDMKLVMGVCERIYVLDYGRIIAEGSPDAIRSDPKVIAAYLGEDDDADAAPSAAAD